MRRPKDRAWLLAVPLLLLLTFLLLRLIWAAHMHPDETLVYVFTRFDIPYTVNYLAHAGHPSAAVVGAVLDLAACVAGDTEFAGRMLSLLFSLITLALAYRIGRDWFGKARYGLFAVAVLRMPTPTSASTRWKFAPMRW